MSRQRSMRSVRSAFAACTATALCLAACRIAGAEDSAPRTLMRLPRWIETLGESSEPRRIAIPTGPQAMPPRRVLWPKLARGLSQLRIAKVTLVEKRSVVDDIGTEAEAPVHAVRVNAQDLRWHRAAGEIQSARQPVDAARNGGLKLHFPVGQSD